MELRNPWRIPTNASYLLPHIDEKSYVDPNTNARVGKTIKRANICVNILVFTVLINIGYSESTNSLYNTANVGLGTIS